VLWGAVAGRYRQIAEALVSAARVATP